MYFNLDYARSRGIEVEYKKRAANFMTANATASYSIATGKSSSPKDELLLAPGQLEERSIKENYLSWDRPFRLALDLNFFAGKKDRYRVLRLTLPANWDLYFRTFLQSGKRYTTYTRIERTGEIDQYVANNKDPYSAVSQSWHWVELSFKKYFRAFGLRLCDA